MHVNRYHWAISHYIGSQLRQCVLDPDGHRPSDSRELADGCDAFCRIDPCALLPFSR